jgi:hypothetical protein
MKHILLSALLGVSVLSMACVSQARPVVAKTTGHVTRDAATIKKTVISPPAPIVLRALPRGHRTIVRDGQRYFLVSGRYFIHGDRRYLSVSSNSA